MINPDTGLPSGISIVDLELHIAELTEQMRAHPDVYHDLEPLRSRLQAELRRMRAARHELEQGAFA